MSAYEYKVVPAPTKGTKAKGLKTGEARFAHTIEELMNTLGADGWEYLRADTLPSVERSGLTGSATEWRHLLIFRRTLKPAPDFEPETALETPLLVGPSDPAAEDPETIRAKAAATLVARRNSDDDDDPAGPPAPPTPKI